MKIQDKIIIRFYKCKITSYKCQLTCKLTYRIDPALARGATNDIFRSMKSRVDFYFFYSVTNIKKNITYIKMKHKKRWLQFWLMKWWRMIFFCLTIIQTCFFPMFCFAFKSVFKLCHNRVEYIETMLLKVKKKSNLMFY